MRLSLDTYYIRVAKAVAERSTCLDKRVGCVLVDAETKRQILATGYNGNPSGILNCCDSYTGCLKEQGHNCMAVHAEINALLQRQDQRSFIAYCTLEPCLACTGALLNAGCAEVIYVNPTNMYKSGKILWQQVQPSHMWRQYEKGV